MEWIFFGSGCQLCLGHRNSIEGPWTCGRCGAEFFPRAGAKQAWSEGFGMAWAPLDESEDESEDYPVTPSRHEASCASCGRPLVVVRADARYCSSACRQRAYRARAIAD